jgi:dimethylamine---corrinoid protein Co-methyltransferase
MEKKIPTRMGDGSLTQMSRSEIRTDLEAGTQDAARRAKVPPLSESELDHLLDIFASTVRFTAVDLGDEVVLSCDGSGNADLDRLDGLYSYQSHLGADLVELWGIDYSFKAIKNFLSYEANLMKEAQQRLVAPVQYGAMPNLGLYSQPDGPCPNWSELLPQGKIDEARAAQEEAVEHAVADMVFVAEAMIAAGADQIDFDTVGGPGDADFLAALRATEHLRARHPDIGIEMGMAGEFVLGMHGQLTYEGTRLAGLWPGDQMKVARKAGVTMFGPAVNVNTRKSQAWNTARAITIVKPCTAEAEIPIHMNAGMGVGSVPMAPYVPVDACSRASKALVELLGLDGL